MSSMTVGCGGEASGPELGAKLIELSRLVDVVNLQFSSVAAEFAKTDQYDDEGFDSPISWIKANCHLPGGAAGDRVCAGEQLDRLGESEVALAEGRIGFAHFALLARTAAAAGERFQEGKLLRKAQKLSVARFRNECMHARHAADPDGFVNEEKQGVEARSLTMSTADDGTVLLNCVLDKIGGAAVQTALEPLAKRVGHDDDRLRDRRLADALVDLAMHALDTGLVPQRTHLQVTTSLETLLGLSGAPAAEMEFSLPISAKAVERLACDCSVTRILLGSDSTVIEVGRARRVISGPQRKALEVRDRGCVWPGCDRPASWTSGHHLVHWIRNGPTDLPNLTLLCYRHHWMVHEGDWQIVRSDDGVITIPPTRTFGPVARGPD
ncbi:MAG: hypothetical protein AUG06_08495 [Actinobacteria bacterium 13_1_20CM_2_65_11]|nr:MAG: hypothetical protein AUJ02_02375 [Chloroflexi bacterium 13_1_40CM_3_65_12]OLE79192.1 MAG: hypothetical protein AUG06_08495 [Actinobacteria bacterium 13_1_20CM_2_65_11]